MTNCVHRSNQCFSRAVKNASTVPHPKLRRGSAMWRCRVTQDVACQRIRRRDTTTYPLPAYSPNCRSSAASIGSRPCSRSFSDTGYRCPLQYYIVFLKTTEEINVPVAHNGAHNAKDENENADDDDHHYEPPPTHGACYCKVRECFHLSDYSKNIDLNISKRTPGLAVRVCLLHIGVQRWSVARVGQLMSL